MKENETIVTTYLKDYRPPSFIIITVDLQFDLDPSRTTVRSKMQVKRNPQAGAEKAKDLVLVGEAMDLKQLTLNGRALQEADYQSDANNLTVFDVPDRFELEVENTICPAENTSLEGLYLSSGHFCTQCEAEGFRKITYFLDRPDVMAKYSVLIRGDKNKYPVLLSNGNPVEQGEGDNGTHWVRWEDPFPKPSYLFALVAGDLVCIEDQYKTSSGRLVDLQIYVEAHNQSKCGHAMQSLINAMRWDEQTFGLEYDLDRYMIVAVDDFNMGAMENKGLNVFNSKYVLADDQTATDLDFQRIEGVIGHEYFHNWTGNRITCRDWFQLSLKEGLTVFRDQEFSSDMGARAVKRIEDVRRLWTVQFSEDASPMAHPIRPDSYMEISNFYTTTIYEKGAEVIRMQHTLLGKDGFRKGMDLYFERHDGQAVTTDDFVAAMEDANDVDLKQFRLWYSQAGTPKIVVSDRYDSDARCYELTITQTCPPTPGQPNKAAMLIPVRLGLLDEQGKTLSFTEQAGVSSQAGSAVLNVTQSEQTFKFNDIPSKPVPSLLRDFSAPVNIEYDYDEQDLILLMANDPDSFNRWDAGQKLAMRVIHRLLEDDATGVLLSLSEAYIEAVEQVLGDDEQSPALRAEALILPSELYIAEQVDVIDVDAIHKVREFILSELAKRLRDAFYETYYEYSDSGAYQRDADSIGRRALKNVCLKYLVQTGSVDMVGIAVGQYRDANNMTDRMAALTLIASLKGAMRDDVLGDFYQQWKNEILVVNKWLTVQAISKAEDTLQLVKDLMQHEAFSIKNPNKVYALIGGFTAANPVRFHAPDGGGHRLLADVVLQLDRLNPQVASRMIDGFGKWKSYDEPRKDSMQKELKRLQAESDLSKDVFEKVSKFLA